MPYEPKATSTIESSRKLMSNLDRLWRDITKTSGIQNEFAYRVNKLVQKLDSVSDKMFVKTVKASEMLSECKDLTQQFKSSMDRREDRTYILLTRLEHLFNDLVTKTHEFRVKAG